MSAAPILIHIVLANWRESLTVSLNTGQTQLSALGEYQARASLLRPGERTVGRGAENRLKDPWERWCENESARSHGTRFRLALASEAGNSRCLRRLRPSRFLRPTASLKRIPRPARYQTQLDGQASRTGSIGEIQIAPAETPNELAVSSESPRPRFAVVLLSECILGQGYRCCSASCPLAAAFAALLTHPHTTRYLFVKRGGAEVGSLALSSVRWTTRPRASGRSRSGLSTNSGGWAHGLWPASARAVGPRAESCVARTMLGAIRNLCDNDSHLCDLTSAPEDVGAATDPPAPERKSVLALQVLPPQFAPGLTHLCLAPPEHYTLRDLGRAASFNRYTPPGDSSIPPLMPTLADWC
ncbi:hypothetical protein FB451DRAFT_1369468 [Mycena latifolia]|nr:hypothetical protein FB451DRAFT_1369468 [Mycena latifolia]